MRTTLNDTKSGRHLENLSYGGKKNIGKPGFHTFTVNYIDSREIQEWKLYTHPSFVLLFVTRHNKLRTC